MGARGWGLVGRQNVGLCSEAVQVCEIDAAGPEDAFLPWKFPSAR